MPKVVPNFLLKRISSVSLLYNRFGERIYLVGDVKGSGTPDIYEAPRSLFDFQVSKKFNDKKSELKFTISDILNQYQTFYQNSNTDTKYNKDTDAIRFRRKFGTTFGITFNYSL